MKPYLSRRWRLATLSILCSFTVSARATTDALRDSQSVRFLEDRNNHNNHDNNNNNNNDRQHNNNNNHQNSYSYSYSSKYRDYGRSYSRDGYYDADSSTSSRSRYKKGSFSSSSSANMYTNYYTHLSDVLACLAMALGWAVWMLSSLVRPTNDSFLIARYHTESMLVRGHIRQVSIEDSELGVPVYRAVIDYMVPAAASLAGAASPLAKLAALASSSATASVEITTANQHLFPQNRTADSANDGAKDLSSSIHSDSQPGKIRSSNILTSEQLPQQQEQVHIRKRFDTQQPLREGFANVELLVLPSEPTQSVLREDWEKEWEDLSDDRTDWWKKAKCRRLSMFFSGLIVLASVAGAVHVVERLAPSQQVYGWAMVCAGVPLIMPGALFVHWCLQAFQQFIDMNTEAQGIIISNEKIGSKRSSMFPSCRDFDILDARACHDDELLDDSEFSIKTNVTETAGCYFIRMPATRGRVPRGHSLEHSIHPTVRTSSNSSLSVSTISSQSVQGDIHLGVSV